MANPIKMLEALSTKSAEFPGRVPAHMVEPVQERRQIINEEGVLGVYDVGLLTFIRDAGAGPTFFPNAARRFAAIKASPPHFSLLQKFWSKARKLGAIARARSNLQPDHPGGQDGA